jgi:hypothetical protein
MSCDEQKIYCELNNYTINYDSCNNNNKNDDNDDDNDDDDDDDDDTIGGETNCTDLILNCTYVKNNLQNYCNIILLDFLNYDVAIEYYNQNFKNQTFIAYLYNQTICTIQPIYENSEITTFGLSLIILGFIVIIAYVYILRDTFSEICIVRLNTKYALKKYKTIGDNIDIDDKPPKYSEN